MSAFLSSLDASSKRWLIVFALAAVVTIGVLAHSFLSALAPPKEVVKPQPFPVTVGRTYTSSQPAWDSAQQNRSTGYPNNIPPAPSSGHNPPAALATPTNWVKVVHMQAEDLRKKVVESKDPDDVKQRTLERIDEMEKNGLLIQ